MSDPSLPIDTRVKVAPRATQAARSVPWRALTGIVFLGALAIIVLTFADYGVTWDEDWHLTYGEYIVQWYRSGFQDTRALTYWTLPLQGGFTATVSRLAARLVPLGRFESAHLVTGLLGLAGVAGVYRLGSLLGGRAAGLVSAVFLLLTPRYYGHLFNNLIDIPFAALSIWTLYYLVAAIRHQPRAPKRLMLAAGTSLGLALAIRTGGVLLVGYSGLAVLLWLAWSWINRQKGVTLADFFRSDLVPLARYLAIVLALAYLVMLVFWPAAILRPLVQPAKGLLYATRFEYSFEVLFEGQYIPNKELPWYFLPKWFLITLPEFYFLGLASGALLAAVTARKGLAHIRITDPTQPIAVILLLVSIGLPLAYTALLRPANYDGLRHYLFVLPPLAILAGASLASLVSRLRSNWIAGALVLVVMASGALTVLEMVRLHPYQYVYFNYLAGGGLSQAASGYETDYWGSSYKEGVDWLVANYPSEASKAVGVASCSYSESTAYFLPEAGFEYLGSLHDGQTLPAGASPDILLATPRWDCHKQLPGEVIHTVSRNGVPLLYVIEVQEQ